MVRFVSVSGRHNGYALSTRAVVITATQNLSAIDRYYEKKKMDKRKTVKHAGKMIKGI